jgi:Bacterial Ig-like domain (group 2)/Two component regulator propeller
MKLTCVPDWFILTMIIIFVYSCKKEPVVSTKITLVPVGLLDSIRTVSGTLIPTASLTLKVGQTDTIRATVTPSNDSDKISWNTSNSAIAGVDQSGLVTGIATGTTLITATIGNGNITATCRVTVSRWLTYNQSGADFGAIAIDAQGNKWFGSDIGVFEFDGTNWTTYNTSNSGLAEDYVRTLAIDAQGNKWFGTDNAGISKFDGTNWTTYDTGNSGLTSNHIEAMVIDGNGNKWFGTGAGVSEFDGSNWTSFLAKNSISAITIDAKGNIWFGGNGIWKFDGNQMTLIYNTASGPNGIAGYSVWTIAIDSQGSQWFGTESGVYEFDGTRWTTYNHLESGLAGNWVGAIAIDAQHNVWFATLDGVSKFDGTNWTVYNAQGGSFIFGVGMVCMNIDAQGNKWFGSFGVVEFYNQ